MMKIGQFSLLSGLSIKALRHYDQCGLLPADVDPHTGYRWYSATQLADADLIRILRTIGLSIEETQAALDPDLQTDILHAHQRKLAQQRELQDKALRAIQHWNTANIEVRTRTAPKTHWAGYSILVAATEDNSANIEQASAALNTPPEDSVQPYISGEPWFTLSSYDDKTVEITICYPVTEIPRTTTMRTGTLPERTEAYVLALDEHFHEFDDLPGGPLPHPASYALAAYFEELSEDQYELRQRFVGEQLELSLTL